MTISFFVVHVLMAHTVPRDIILGVDNSVRVLGSPLHNIIAEVLDWFSVLAVSIIWNRYPDKLEEEILASSSFFAAVPQKPQHAFGLHPASATGAMGRDLTTTSSSATLKS